MRLLLLLLAVVLGGAQAAHAQVDRSGPAAPTLADHLRVSDALLPPAPRPLVADLGSAPATVLRHALLLGPCGRGIGTGIFVGVVSGGIVGYVFSAVGGFGEMDFPHEYGFVPFALAGGVIGGIAGSIAACPSSGDAGSPSARPE